MRRKSSAPRPGPAGSSAAPNHPLPIARPVPPPPPLIARSAPPGEALRERGGTGLPTPGTPRASPAASRAAAAGEGVLLGPRGAAATPHSSRCRESVGRVGEGEERFCLGRGRQIVCGGVQLQPVPAGGLRSGGSRALLRDANSTRCSKGNTTCTQGKKCFL